MTIIATSVEESAKTRMESARSGMLDGALQNLKAYSNMIMLI
jgi:hypothetical protein